jgi:hypothetical protein
MHRGSERERESETEREQEKTGGKREREKRASPLACKSKALPKSMRR